MIETMEIVTIILLCIKLYSDNAEINSMQKDIRRLNGIVKILQARNGMRADGIDRVGG